MEKQTSGEKWLGQSSEKEFLARREFLKGMAAMFGAAIFSRNTAEASSILEKTISQESKETDANLKKLSFEFFFSEHLTGADKLGIAEKIKKADIFVPEMPGWNEKIKQLYQAVANGEMTPQEFARKHGFLEDPVYGNEISFLGTIRPLYKTGVRVEFIDIPADHPIDQDLLKLEENLEDINLLDIKFSELSEKFKEYLKDFSRLNVLREEYILKQLDELAHNVQEGKFSGLKTSQNVRILLAFGAIHTGLFRTLSSTGRNVRWSFARMPFIFGYNSEAVRRFMLGKEVPSELAARALFERLVAKALFLRLPGSESQPKVTFLRRALDKFSLSELEKLFLNMQSENFRSSSIAEIVKNAIKAKGINWPLTREELLKLTS